VKLNKQLIGQNFSQLRINKFLQFSPLFDLKFLLSKKNNDVFENKLAKFMISFYQNSFISLKKRNIIKQQILRAFIIESQQVQPSISKNLIDFIILNYNIWRMEDKENYI